MSRALKEVRRYYDSRTGRSFNVNIRTGMVCGVDGEYPDKATEARVHNAVLRRVRDGAAKRRKDEAMKDVGMVKVRGNLGGT